MGEYLRRFWHPVAAAIEFEQWPVRKVRVLGEDLALFRRNDGSFGLVAERCPHRGASLACGMPDDAGLRCAYHGWAFDIHGQCVETPAESEGSTLGKRIRIAAYPVQAVGGLVWAYMGPSPAPLLPRFEHVVSEGWNRSVGVSVLPCHWLQVAENTLDPVHVEHLHMKYLNWHRKRQGLEPAQERHHARIAFDLFELGIIKRRLWEGEREDSHEWTIGHPLVFPATAVAAISEDWVQYQFRVPIDDANTTIYWYDAKRRKNGEPASSEVPLWENPWQDEDGGFIPARFHGQDMMVWITQGTVTDRSLENLGESDRGIALYRRALLRDIERVKAGEDPAGVIRDAARNTPFITLPLETRFNYNLAGIQMSAADAFPQREGTE